MAEVMYTVQKELRPCLDTDEAYPHVHALINFFGAMPMRVLVRSSFRHMVLKFCEYNLSEFDVLAVEEIISIRMSASPSTARRTAIKALRAQL